MARKEKFGLMRRRQAEPSTIEEFEEQVDPFRRSPCDWLDQLSDCSMAFGACLCFVVSGARK